MTRGGRRNPWLRMTDSMGLTEPGKKPEMPGPRLLLFQVVLWFAMTLVWIGMLTQTQGEDVQVLYGVLVVLSLVLTVANFVLLRRARKSTDDSGAGGQANKPTR